MTTMHFYYIFHLVLAYVQVNLFCFTAIGINLYNQNIIIILMFLKFLT